MAGEEMPEHWLLEYINLDAFDHLDNHLGPPTPEEDTQVTAKEGKAGNETGSVAGKTADNAADHMAIHNAGNNTSAEALHLEKVIEKGKTAEEIDDASPALDHGSRVEKKSEDRDTLAPNDAEPAFPDNQPLAQNKVEMGAGKIQPRAPDQVEMKPKANQLRGPKPANKVKNAGQPRAPSNGKTKPGFANRGLETVPKAPTMSVGAHDLGHFTQALHQTNSQPAPAMQNAGMSAGAAHHFDFFDQASHQHCTNMQSAQHPGFPVRYFEIGWVNQPAPQPAPLMQTVGVPLGDFCLQNQNPYQTNVVQSAYQMQNSGMPEGAFGQPLTQTNLAPSPLLDPKFTDEDFERALKMHDPSMPQSQASSSRRKPALVGQATRPKAINPNVQSGPAQKQGRAKAHGKRKASGEETEPRRVSAGKTDAGEKVAKAAKPRKKSKQSTFTLSGPSQTRKYRNHIMTSYHCSDGIIRILAGQELEEAQARTEAKKKAGGQAYAAPGGQMGPKSGQ